MPAAPTMRAFLITLGLIYPLLVYCGYGTIPPAVFILTALALIAVRKAQWHGLLLDFEQEAMHTVIVRATDRAGASTCAPTPTPAPAWCRSSRATATA